MLDIVVTSSSGMKATVRGATTGNGSCTEAPPGGGARGGAVSPGRTDGPGVMVRSGTGDGGVEVVALVIQHEPSHAGA